MKKVLFLLLASFLVLAACGNKEESKSENKKETKSSSKDSKKDDKKSKEDKSDEDSKQVAEGENTHEQPTAQENVQSQEQQTQQVEQPIQQDDNPSDTEIEAMREQSKQSPHGLQTEPSQGELPADLNEHEEQNTNLHGEHVVAPGWTQEEQSQAYEDYKKKENKPKQQLGHLLYLVQD